ncbi:hypothetical protein [Micromonospora sp. SL4-19]|uniref:hypothetical protein n=1 Tax=Micromonospora sp. SL4-19 TaxID=3399129 RepID=UPI003A4E0DCD
MGFGFSGLGFGDVGVAGAEGLVALGLAEAELRVVAPVPAVGVPVRSEVGEGLAEARVLGDWSGERVGGGSQVGLAVDSTNGTMVSGRAGPPAKLTPTTSVEPTPSTPKPYARRRSHRRRRPLGSTKTGGGSGTTGMMAV